MGGAAKESAAAAAAPAAAAAAAPAAAADEDKPVLTRYELVRVLSARAQQLADGVSTTLKGGHAATPFKTAVEELIARRIPMSIVRKFPDGRAETLSVNQCDVPEAVFSHVRSLEL
jgi:DNA-directed RNA polymerase subunit K/omega